jgi:hypothetical protein
MEHARLQPPAPREPDLGAIGAWHHSQIDATKTRLPRSTSLPQLAERGRYNDRADVMLSDMAPNLSGNKCVPSSHAPRARKHRDAGRSIARTLQRREEPPDWSPRAAPRPRAERARDRVLDQERAFGLVELALAQADDWLKPGGNCAVKARSAPVRAHRPGERAPTGARIHLLGSPTDCRFSKSSETGAAAGVPRGGVRRVPGADAHKVRRGAHAQARCVAGTDQRGIPGRRRLPQVCFRRLDALSPVAHPPACTLPCDTREPEDAGFRAELRSRAPVLRHSRAPQPKP